MEKTEEKKEEKTEVNVSDWLTKEELDIIRNQFFPPDATAIEMRYCMKVAQSLNLNPILKQIYFVERSSKVDGQWIKKIEPLPGRDAFLLLAHRSGDFEGLDTTSGIKAKPTLVNNKWELIANHL